MKKSYFIVLLLSIIFITTGCKRKPGQLYETPTRGNIKITVDESYTLLIEAEKATFESLYPYAKINVFYKTEAEAFNDYFNDSVRLMIVNKKLTPDQEKYLYTKKIIARTTMIAYDAVAFIINKENPDSNIRYDELKDLFTGRLSSWKQINKHSAFDKITIVFDNEKSGNVRYLKEKFEITGKFPSYCFAVNKNEEVINYVEKNKNAIGVISVNWISDKFDSTTKGFLSRIRVAEVGDINNTDGTGNYYRPYQGNIALSNYPFTRAVYVISRETFSGLGTGFASFVAGEKGQRIVKISGLLPAAMPVRLIEIKR